MRVSAPIFNRRLAMRSIVAGTLLIAAGPLSAQELSVEEIERLHVEAQRAAARGDEEGSARAIEIWSRIAKERARVGDAVRQGVALNNIALVERKRGNHEQALLTLEQARAIAASAGHAGGQLTATYNAGRVLEELDRTDEALVAYEEALRLIEGLPDRHQSRLHVDLLKRVEALRPEPSPGQ